MEVQKVSCDVLCVGGGIAGLMAAIEAADNGAKVIVAEKAHVERSGSGGMGNDHFHCYIPQVHGDYEEFAEDLLLGQMAGRIASAGREAADFWFKNTYKIIQMWESWGIPMKYEGEYHFAGHGFPGQILNHLKYSGKNQKRVLTEQTLKRGVEIINRCMVFELITNDEGAVIGALGLSTKDEIFYKFEAKAVILGTGVATRLYPGKTLHDFNRAYPGSCTGDGRAMAYRAGAELTNIEMTARHAGPKYFIRAGQATWVGVLRERNGKPVGPFITKPDRIYNDMTTEVNKRIYDDYLANGKGPIYMSGVGISDEDYDYMVHWLRQEGNDGLLNHMKEEGIDYRKHPVEFMTFDMGCWGGLSYNAKGETSLNGLYAAGDENLGGISCAAVFGWSAGRNAAKYAATKGKEDIDKYNDFINEKFEKAEEILHRKEGPDWREANAALQQIMRDYGSEIRSEPILDAGIENLARLKKRAHERVTAGNVHELSRCLEVFNLMDIGELVLIGAKERKETRGLHVRPDYPLTNPMLDRKAHIIRKGPDGRPVHEWKVIE